MANRINPGGFCVAAAYVLIVVAVLVLTALTTKVSDVGLDWIPFVLLAMPWYAFHNQLLLPGLIANAGLLYLLGTVLERFSRRLGRRKSWGCYGS